MNEINLYDYHMAGIYKELDYVTHGSEYRIKKSTFLIIPYPSCTPESTQDFKIHISELTGSSN